MNKFYKPIHITVVPATKHSKELWIGTIDAGTSLALSDSLYHQLMKMAKERSADFVVFREAQVRVAQGWFNALLGRFVAWRNRREVQ